MRPTASRFILSLQTQRKAAHTSAGGQTVFACLFSPLLFHQWNLTPLSVFVCGCSHAALESEEVEEDEEEEGSASDSESDEEFEDPGPGMAPEGAVTSPARRQLRFLPSHVKEKWKGYFKSEAAKAHSHRAWYSFRRGRRGLPSGAPAPPLGVPGGPRATHAGNHMGASRQHDAKKSRSLDGMFPCLVGTATEWAPRLVILQGFVTFSPHPPTINTHRSTTPFPPSPSPPPHHSSLVPITTSLVFPLPCPYFRLA